MRSIHLTILVKNTCPSYNSKWMLVITGVVSLWNISMFSQIENVKVKKQNYQKSPCFTVINSTQCLFSTESHNVYQDYANNQISYELKAHLCYSKKGFINWLKFTIFNAKHVCVVLFSSFIPISDFSGMGHWDILAFFKNVTWLFCMKANY